MVSLRRLGGADLGGWGERTAPANRALREELFARGRFDGYLLFVDGRPAGWCQCGPRDAWPKLVRQYALAPNRGTSAGDGDRPASGSRRSLANAAN